MKHRQYSEADRYRAGQYINFPKSGQAYQGDIRISTIDKLPNGVCEVPAVNGVHVVAHSETGHHHLVNARTAKLFRGDNPNVCYLRVEGAYADLDHERPVNPHLTIRLLGKERCYEIVRQQEWTPEGWRMIQD